MTRKLYGYLDCEDAPKWAGHERMWKSPLFDLPGASYEFRQFRCWNGGSFSITLWAGQALDLPLPHRAHFPRRPRIIAPASFTCRAAHCR